jgi:NitT/TauT family transport system substrate-binding protein
MSKAFLPVALALLVACGQSGGTAQPSPSTVTKLQVGLVGGISDAAFYIANDKGYFKEQGIELEISRFDSAARMVAPLGTGQLDVGGGAPSAGLLNAIARDVPLKIVADKGDMVPGHGYEALMVRKALWDKGGMRSASDLRGKTVALSARDISPEVTLSAFLKTGGLTVKDVNVVTMAHADMVTALANGSIDAGLPIEPFVTKAVANGVATIWKRDDEIAPRQQVAVVLYGPRFAENRDLGRRFMLAYLKGARYYNSAFDKADAAKRSDVIQILVRNTAVKDADLYEKMVMPGIDPNGRVNVDSLADQQDYFLSKGSQKTRVELKQVVDMQYADWAVQKLGQYK